MRPRHAPTVAVAALGGGALLWYAWLVFRADLTAGTTAAATVLWLVAAATVATLAAYVREVERLRDSPGRRRRTAKPLPALLLLWVAGLTALVVFPFMLSGAEAAASTSDAVVPHQPSATAETAADARPRGTASTPASRSTQRTPTTAARTTAAPSPTSTGATSREPAPSVTSTAAPRPTSTRTPTRTASPTSTTSTSGPIITVTLPHSTKTRHG